MIENSYTVLSNMEPLPAAGVAEEPWVEVRGKRILLVEDEETLRVCLRMMLQMEGHQVTEAKNGAEALDLFRVGQFDVVITDFQMPVMQGNELAAGLKLLAPSLPILMITASPKARPNAQNPVDALLNKPFTLPELHGALGKLFSARPAPGQSDALPTLDTPPVTFAAERTPSCLPAGVTVSS